MQQPPRMLVQAPQAPGASGWGPENGLFHATQPKNRDFRGENHAFVVLWSLKTSVKMTFRMESGHSMAKSKLKLQWSTWNPPMGRRDLNYKAIEHII